jgi:hypothetical protein
MSDPTTNHYFVDEAGDPILFGRGGKVLVGTEGCSHHFMLGIAKVTEPLAVVSALEDLRAALLADPYFRGVPSMQAQAKKTAVCFHAKDDVPEVRWEVFRLLRTFKMKIHVGVRRKRALVDMAQVRRLQDSAFRLHPDDIYDGLVMRLFEPILHKADENKILFARRGKSDRIRALGTAIQSAKARFQKRRRKACDRPTAVQAAYPSQHPCLQAIDYYLWALQRLYERQEDRYFEYLRDDYCVIMDQDCVGRKREGEWFCGGVAANAG